MKMFSRHTGTPEHVTSAPHRSRANNYEILIEAQLTTSSCAWNASTITESCEIGM